MTWDGRQAWARRDVVGTDQPCFEACHIVGMLAGSEAEELCHLACLEMALELHDEQGVP